MASVDAEGTLHIDELNESLDTSALARGISTLGDLILVAPPGMGKTTTLFQIAEAVLEANNGTPIVVPLGNWSAEETSLLSAILRRPAFRAISDEDFRSAAAQPGVFLLLDGWNELDSQSRRRAAAEIERLQRELPTLGFVVATREQGRVAPIDATAVRLRSLNAQQQIEIARELRGEEGEGIVDRAWRTSGVRELVTVPLYLTALLALPQDEEFPRTKEEVLRRFVDLHEKDFQRSEALAEATGGFHARYLRELGRTATRAANTTIRASAARRSVSVAADGLEAEGQIAMRPQPNTVLDALVNHHLLIREKGPGGFAFQHQQFQEWYASHAVEELMAKSVNDRDSRDALRSDILNERRWEEPILFACERLARGDEAEQEVCAASILAALEVDPMLAAEMVWRSSEGVWKQVSQRVEDFVERWHTPGQVDRAVRFMIVSGRGEFRDNVWPLITHENDQVHLRALRAGGRFRPSVLGEDAAGRISRLSSGLRQTILDEIAMDGGMDGLEFAADVARDDPDPKVKAKVAEGLAFREAERHIAAVLRDADEATFDLLQDRDLYERIADEAVRLKLAAARDRERARGIPPRERLDTLIHKHDAEDASEEVANIIAQIEIDPRIEHQDYIVDLANERFPRAVAEGLLQRVRDARNWCYTVEAFEEGFGEGSTSKAATLLASLMLTLSRIDPEPVKMLNECAKDIGEPGRAIFCFHRLNGSMAVVVILLNPIWKTSDWTTRSALAILVHRRRERGQGDARHDCPTIARGDGASDRGGTRAPALGRADGCPPLPALSYPRGAQHATRRGAGRALARTGWLASGRVQAAAPR